MQELANLHINDKGVNDSLYRWYGEFPPKNSLGDTGSQRLPALLILRIGDSPYLWCAEMLTPVTLGQGSWRLPIQRIRGVDDSPYQRTGRRGHSVSTIRKAWRVSWDNSAGASVYQWYAELVTLRVNDEGSQATLYFADNAGLIFNYEYLCEFKVKIAKTLTVVSWGVFRWLLLNVI